MQQFKYEQLAAELADEIKQGKWQQGDKLPSIRMLAAEYKLAKISIQHALHKLEKQGLIYAKPKAGFFVSAKSGNEEIQHKVTTAKAPKPVNMPDIFLDIMEHSAAFDIVPQYGFEQKTSTAINYLSRCLTRAQRQQIHSKSVYYSSPAGLKELREQIALHYARRGLTVSADDICITSGCQNSLYLSLQTTIKAGDTVAVESPAFYGILQLLQQLQCKVIEIPSSPTQGLGINLLTDAANKWQINACIVTPNFATPTGAKMPIENKQKLIALAQQYNFQIIEDDVYGDLGFSNTSQPLKALDITSENNERVVLCGSFSKALSRDLRLGWVITNKHHKAITKAKLVQQLATSQTVQQAMYYYLSDGYFERHLNHYRRVLQNQKEQLLAALNQYWQFNFKYTVPDGGIALWVELPAHIDSLALYHQAIEHQIVITPGNLFTNSGAYSNYIRLSFAHEIKNERLVALKVLAKLITKQLKT